MLYHCFIIICATSKTFYNRKVQECIKATKTINAKSKYCHFIIVLSLFMPHQKCFVTEKSKNVLKLPKPLMLLYDVSNRNLDKNKMEKKIDDIIINMTVTNEKVQYLEASTKNQSDSQPCMAPTTPWSNHKFIDTCHHTYIHRQSSKISY